VAAVVWMTRNMGDVPAPQGRRTKLQRSIELCGVVQRGEGLFWSGIYNALLFAAAVFTVQRTIKYASRLRISGALHLDIPYPVRDKLLNSLK